MHYPQQGEMLRADKVTVSSFAGFKPTCATYYAWMEEKIYSKGTNVPTYLL